MFVMQVLARVAVLLVFVLLGALAPQAALAHGGAPHHEAPPAPLAEEHASSPELQVWSPRCPESPVHVCGCGNLALCEGSGKPVLRSGVGYLLTSAIPAEPVRWAGEVAPLSEALPGALARAPRPSPDLESTVTRSACSPERCERFRVC